MILIAKKKGNKYDVVKRIRKKYFRTATAGDYGELLVASKDHKKGDKIECLEPKE